MSTTTTPMPPPEQRFLLQGMSWDFYEHLLAELDNRPIRVTYDRGALELMSPSYRHEICSDLLGSMVKAIAEELRLPIKAAGSTTFRRESLERGLEPDKCFYIAHVSDILGKEELNLESDPPPDLAIEVDITHGSLDRMPIYAELGVPELWRFDGEQLLSYQLKDIGEYAAPAEQSLAFPQLPLSGLRSFLERATTVEDGTLLREFRDWVRSTIRDSE